MDARIVGPMSPCTTTRQTALGYVSFTLTFNPPSLTLTFRRHTRQNARTVAHLCSHSHTQINGVRINKGQSAILRDGNEIAFGSPMQQQNPVDDYRFIYRHLAPVELTGVHAFYDMAHELGRGTFVTAMKAMSRRTGEWWAVRIIHTQKLRPSNNNNNINDNPGGDNNNNNRKDSANLAGLPREVSILEQLNHPNICRLVGGNDLCELFSLVYFGMCCEKSSDAPWF